ncbi:MAG TPA: phosphopantetheine-binding protein [Streptosporangiaceae bacterium]
MHREVLSEPLEDEPPQTEMEHLIVSVWTDVLKAEVSSRYDDFFLLGGSSMSAIQVSAELTERLGFRVPPRTVYEFTELADLAERLTRLRAASEG